MRAISRVTGASINTVTKLLMDAGAACAEYHDETVRDVRAKRVQADEIWSFTYAKQANVEKAKKAPEGAGDTWTWTALEADSKLIISWYVGPRDPGSADTFMMDLAERLHGRVQLTTDGLGSYLTVVEDAFGADVDYSQLIKLYGSEPAGEKRYSPAKCIGAVEKPITGDPAPAHISTSYVERHNLSMRRSKRLANHFAMLSIYFVFYNFCRIHKTLRVTPAMQAGLSDTVHDVDWIVGRVEARDPKLGPRGPYKKRQPTVSN